MICKCSVFRWVFSDDLKANLAIVNAFCECLNLFIVFVKEIYNNRYFLSSMSKLAKETCDSKFEIYLPARAGLVVLVHSCHSSGVF